MTSNNTHSENTPFPLIAVVGTTASGKTSFAVRLAATLGGEIISADSRQVYRGMDIGTGKDLAEYILEDGTTIPYHLIDVEDPGQFYNLYSWLEGFRQAYQEIQSRRRYPILCGGTGLYVESALDGRRLSPVPENSRLREELQALSHRDLLALLRRYPLLSEVDTTSHRRAIRALEIAQYNASMGVEGGSTLSAEKGVAKPLPHILFILDWSREERRNRIARRLEQRIQDGMIEEVASLLKKGVPQEVMLSYGLEYRFLTLYLVGELTRDEALERLEIAIKQFAKRQMTWFRGMQRRGFIFHHLEGTLPTDELLSKAIPIVRSYEANA